tara:strand:- start:352 stop:615 length:264 start_codon:yes stop_codon:yes gene_type:complete
MTDSELIKNYTLFHAYFCHLIEDRQTDAAEYLCDISFKLDQEITKRKISEFEIKECVKNTNFNAQDHLMVYTYIYPEFDYLSKITNS